MTTASLLTYPNCTFLGLPLCRALFGEMAVLYNAMFLVAFNVLFFTWQVSAFTGQKINLRNLCTLPTIATAVLVLMLALGWHLPAPAQTVAASTGAMITPLSLIIIGVMMSESRLTEILRALPVELHGEDVVEPVLYHALQRVFVRFINAAAPEFPQEELHRLDRCAEVHHTADVIVAAQTGTLLA